MDLLKTVLDLPATPGWIGLAIVLFMIERFPTILKNWLDLPSYLANAEATIAKPGEGKYRWTPSRFPRFAMWIGAVILFWQSVQTSPVTTSNLVSCSAGSILVILSVIFSLYEAHLNSLSLVLKNVYSAIRDTSELQSNSMPQLADKFSSAINSDGPEKN